MKRNLFCYALLLLWCSFSIVHAQMPPGNALNFDGSNDYVDLGTSATLYASNIKTMECWVKFNSFAADQELISRSVAGNGIELLMYGGNLSVYCMDGSSTSFISYPSSNLQLGTWYHVAFSWNGTKETMQMYVNGNTVGTRTDAGNINTGIPNNASMRVYLGRWNDNTAPRYFSGSLDEVRIWSTNRSQALIQANMLNVLSLPATGLLAYYKLDQGIAGGNNTGVLSATDASVNGLTGTLNNFTLTSATTSNWVESYAMVVPVVSATTFVTSSGFTAAWSAPAVGTADKYLLDVSTNSSFSSFVTGYSSKDVGNVTSSAVTGLTPLTTYYYRVRAQKTSVLNQGAFSGTITTATLAQTPPGNAFNFNGSPTGMSVPASAVFDFATGTLECWVKRDAVVNEQTILIANRNDPTTRYSMHMNNFSNVIGLWNGTSFASVVYSPGFVVGKWYHIAMVIKATTSDVYVNGLSTGTIALGMGTATGLPFRIGSGSNSSTGEVLNGSIDEVRVWNTQKTQLEIQSNMYDMVPPASTGLVAYYKFDQGVASGTNTSLVNVADATSGARNGTLFGVNLTGVSSNWVESYALAIPVISAASSLSSTGFIANWSAPARGIVEKYLLDVSTNSTFSSFVAGYNGKDVGAVTSAPVSGLLANTTYFYRVRAEKASVSGQGGYPAPASVATNTTHTWVGGSGDWNTAANWSTNSVPSGCFTDVVIASGSPLVSTAVSAGNLSVSSGINITVTGLLSVCGSFAGGSGTAAVTSGAGKVILNGSSAQAISGNTTFNNVELNNPAGASLAIGGTLSVAGMYTPTAGTLTTNGGFVLKSSASGTALVYRGSGIYIAGNVTVERYIPAKRAWRYLTSPLSNTGSVFANWQNNGSLITATGVEIWNPSGNGGFATGGSGSSIQQYDETSDTWTALANTNATNLSNNDGTAGNTVADNKAFGLFVTGAYGSGNISPYSAAASTTLKASGLLQSGTQTFTYDNLAANRFILIGNPYAAPVDFATVAKSNIKNTFWAWDPQRSGTTLGGYVTVSYDVIGGVYDMDYTPLQTAQTQLIQNGQAVFVQVQNGSANTAVSFNETDKISSGNTNSVFRGTGADMSQQLRVVLNRNNGTSGEAVDGVLAKFAPAYSAAGDDDAVKLYNYDENMSLKRHGLKLSIERRPMALDADTLYLNIDALKGNGMYSLEFNGYNFDRLLNAFLVDGYLGTSTPISLVNGSVVSFTVDGLPASSDASRFMVVFRPALALPVSFTGIKALKNGQSVQVEWNVHGETAVDRYVVERSADMNGFIEVGSVAARNNNTNETYTQADSKPLEGDNFYRVKIVEKSGTARYSNVVKVQMAKGVPAFSLYPNPVKDRNVSVQLAYIPKGAYSLIMYDEHGHKLLSNNVDHTGSSSGYRVIMPNVIAPGTYYFVLRGVGKNAPSFRQSIVVQ